MASWSLSHWLMRLDSGDSISSPCCSGLQINLSFLNNYTNFSMQILNTTLTAEDKIERDYTTLLK